MRILYLLFVFLLFSVSSLCEIRSGFNSTFSSCDKSQENIFFDKSNTIYTIDRRLDLQGKTVLVPSDCSLFFLGGYITNGTLVGNKTRIVAQFGKIFSTSLILRGTFTSEKIKMSWWASVASNDNTQEVQQALNSIVNFSNRIFDIDVSVRITDVDFTLKWSPGVKFISSCNSHQGLLGVTVFGENSHGFDISGTENLSFENILFRGDDKRPPKTLLFASRFKQNKQCSGHKFQDVTFCGRVSVSLIYNYSGESWLMNGCRFYLSKAVKCSAMLYATTKNSQELESKFGETELKIKPLTQSIFLNCFFYNEAQCPSIIFEGSKPSVGYINNISSVYFDKCYFFTPNFTTVRFINTTGSIAFLNCIDESGADPQYACSRAFYEFLGDIMLDVLTFSNNTIYTRKSSPILSAKVPVRNLCLKSNLIVNSIGIWNFSELYDSVLYLISDREKLIVTGNCNRVKINK